MSFFNVNYCCSKLNYFLCGSKQFSSKKYQNNIKQKSINNENRSSSLKINSEQTQSIRTMIDLNNKYPNNYQCSSHSYSIINHRLKSKKIILHRNHRYQRLGLTLSYQLKSNNQLNIYIEEIEENSLAHLQGNIEIGDQIIQINNQTFTNRDQAIQLIQQYSTVIFQIIPFQFVEKESILTEDDSGIILACQTDVETIHQKNSMSFPNLLSNDMKIYSRKSFRRCFSLNDLSKLIFLSNQFEKYNHYQSLSSISTNNSSRILKPLPFYNYSNKQNKTHRSIHRKYLKKQKNSHYKLNNSRSFRKTSFNSIEEDFYLLNRIFLRENQNELSKKPYLAIKYQQQSIIQKENLKNFFHNYSFYYPFTSNSTANISINTTPFYSSTIFI